MKKLRVKHQTTFLSGNPYLVNIEKIRVVRHTSAEDLCASEFGTKWNDLEGGGYCDSNGENVITVIDFVKRIKGQGIWGYVGNDNVIHYWTNGRQSVKVLINFFAHEIGHQTGKHQRPVAMEEYKADSYAEVAAFAYKLAMNEKRIKK